MPPTGSSPEVRDHEGTRKQTHIPSYQQINCVDNIIRCVFAAPSCWSSITWVHLMPKQLIPVTLFTCGPVFLCSRYLESCTGPALKRKSDSHSLATSSSSSSTSEDDKPAGATDTAQTSSDGINIPHTLDNLVIMLQYSLRKKH